MKLLPLLLLTLPLHSLSQNSLNYGKAKADQKFCDSIQADLFDKNYGLTPVCNSPNELEIRFVIAGLPIPQITVITITYNASSGWQAFKYKDNYSATWYDSTLERKITKIRLRPTTDFETIFSALKRNDLFSLPSQSELNYKDFILDGVHYTVTFKAGDKFREYRFWNPESLIQRNRRVKEFRKYIRIARLFYTSLVPE